MGFRPNPVQLLVEATVKDVRLLLRTASAELVYWDDNPHCEARVPLDITQAYGRGPVALNPRWWQLDDAGESKQVEGARNAKLTFLGNAFTTKLEQLAERERNCQSSKELLRERSLHDAFILGETIQLYVPFRQQYTERRRNEFKDLKKVDYIATLVVQLAYTNPCD